MLGGSSYECQICPKCGSLMWNGKCENKECEYHWYPIEEEEEE